MEFEYADNTTNTSNAEYALGVPDELEQVVQV